MLVKTLDQISTRPGEACFIDFLNFSISGIPDAAETIVNEHLRSCHLLMREGKPVGRFALYINEFLRYKESPAICIGAYACIDDDDVSDFLLQWAEDLSAKLGYKFCLGPMHGSTWYSYRFSSTNDFPSFMMDINTPQYYNEQFKKFGFSSIASYVSNLVYDQEKATDKNDQLESHFNKKGITVRCIDLDRLDDELRAIADFSNEAFADNFLFTPLDKQIFVKSYSKLKSFLIEDYIWIAENEAGEICSLLFAIKDVTDPTGETLIIKTIAAKKGFKYRGLTLFLLQKLTRETMRKGMHKIIHAFMHQDNISLNFSNKSARAINEYALYGKDISIEKIKN